MPISKIKSDALLTAASNPSSPSNGDMYYNTTDHEVRVYLNGEWRTQKPKSKDEYWDDVICYIRGDGGHDLSRYKRRTQRVGSSTTSSSIGKPFANGNISTFRRVGDSVSSDYLQVTAQTTGGGVGYMMDPSHNPAVTIEWWMYPTSTYSGYGHAIWMGGQGGQGVIKFAGTDGEPYFYNSGGSVIDTSSYSGSSLLNSWHHYVFEFVYNATTGAYQNSAYIDGTRISQTTTAPNTGVSTSNFLIGYSANGSEYGQFYFDELRVTRAARYNGVASITVQTDPWPTE